MFIYKVIKMENSARIYRKVIGIFGRCNAGKSTLLNNIIGEERAITAPVPGTTTDPNRRAFELLPFGPVEFIDTPGLDDFSTLGEIRKNKALLVLKNSEILLLVGNSGVAPGELELRFIEQNLKSKPVIGIVNKVTGQTKYLLAWKELFEKFKLPYLVHDCKYGESAEVRQFLVQNLQVNTPQKIIADLVPAGKSVVMVVPIDAGAPKGRIIQPQMLVLRELLDNFIITHVIQPENLPDLLLNLKEEPGLVVTDSQVFSQVRDLLPEHIPLTSFSILMARFRGELGVFLQGISHLKSLNEGATIGVFEACVHHIQKDDIGTEKIPAIIKNLTGKKFKYRYFKGREFNFDEHEIDLAVHCGGCMLTNEEMKNRINYFTGRNIKLINYGMLFAYNAGILERALRPLGGAKFADRLNG